MPRRSLAIDQALTLLAENPARIAELTVGLTPTQLHATPGRNEWSANEVLAHLRARDRTAHEVVGPVVQLVEERPYLHARRRDLGELALDRSGAKARHHDDMVHAGALQHAQLPFEDRAPPTVEEALR